MGVVDELVQAREDYERGDWARALDTWRGLDPDAMDPAALTGAAVAAYLVGEPGDAVGFYQRSFRLRTDAGDLPGGVRNAFHLAMIHSTSGEPSLASGWTNRLARLVDELGSDTAERGYLAFLLMFQHLQEGALPDAATCSAEVTALGRRHHDSDLVALGLCSGGRIAIYLGDVPAGLASLDESMAVLTSGDVSPEICGNVYCTAIEGCQQIADFGRVAEWTSALQRWCAALPALVTFTGQCSLHRGQVMRQRGAWTEAVDELDRAVDRYRLAHSMPAAGLAEYERGDLLRLMGRYAAADAAYQRSAELGHDPQPGLALLWLATGHADAALGAVRRLLGERTDPVARCGLLPAAVDVLLATATVDEARAAADLLDQVAEQLGTAAVRAMAAYAAGAVEVAADDPAGSLPYLRKATQLWARVDNPYEVARTRVLVGRALTAVGDPASGEAELRAAMSALRSLGATPALADVERLLRPGSTPAGLTAREVEVLRLVAAGSSNATIAAQLVLSEKTVARHLSNIFTKIDVGSRTAAAAYAFEHQLV